MRIILKKKINTSKTEHSKGEITIDHVIEHKKQMEAIEHSKNPKSLAIKYARLNLGSSLPGYYVEGFRA